MVKTIIFDYDGTIHNTLGIYEPAFREAYQWLSEQNVVEEQKIETAQIAGWLGLNSKEMWDTFLPELDSEIQRSGECDRGRFHGQADQEAPGSVVSGSGRDAYSFEEQRISSCDLKQL